METKIIAPSDIEAAGRIIKNGGIVAFPTETVYGLGADAGNEESVKKIFEAKGRPSDNPLIVHIADKRDIYKLASEVNENAKKLIEAFMPGPFTVILKKSELVNDTVSAGLDTVGIRFPENKTAQALIKSAGVPIAAPSANLSGKPSPTKAKHVIADLSGRVDAIIDGEDCIVGVESTIVDASGNIPVLLRPGGITIDELRDVIPETRIDVHVLESVKDDEKPKCPGTKYKHYSPNAEVVVVEGEEAQVQKKINELIEENSDKMTGVLTMYGSVYDKAVMINGGRTNKEYASRMFDALREFDDLKIELVFAEFSECDGFGLAVKNRLYKSAGYNIIHV